MNDKVAVVTGSTRGVGRKTASMYAREGAQVVVTGRKADKGREVVDEIAGNGGDAFFVQAEIGVEEEVKGLMDAAAERYGRIDALVNNGAPTDILRGGGRVDEAPTADWLAVLQIGLTGGVFWTTKYAIPHLRAAGGGSIINISATCAVIGLDGADAYTASKGAMNALTRSFALEYGGSNIRANALILGFVPDDEAWEAARAGKNPMIEVMKSKQLTRIATEDDIAYACVFLGSDESAFITGSLLTIDGGLTIAAAPRLPRR
jgi:NAD(P)-dependent dehydrogenase (short-subunit alcohol dehydrogenase family)